MQFFQNYTDLREKILNTIQELSNVRIDTSEYSFVNQFVNAIAAADDNLLFYISLLLNESNINSALLPETIVQIAKTLGVPTSEPVPATSTVQLKIQINLDESSELIFDESFELKSNLDDTIIYKLRTNYYVLYDSISKKPYVYDLDTNYPIPAYLSYNAEVGKYDLVFDAEIEQISKEVTSFISGETLYHYDLKKIPGFYDYNYKIEVNDILYDYVFTIYQLSSNNYTYSVFPDLTRLYFATDFTGTPIPSESNVKITRYLTLGSKGNTQANTLIVKNNVADLNTKKQPIVKIINPDITNGKDPDDLITFKNKIFSVFLSRNTILSKEYDLRNISNYLPDVKYSKSILKRSIIPDFTTFVDLTVNNEIINTNSVTISNVSNKVVSQDNIYFNLLNNNTYDYQESTDVDYQGSFVQNTAICPFELKYSNDLKLVEYYYLHKVATIPIDQATILKSEYDKITTAGINVITATYSRLDTERKIRFQAYLDLNTPDLSILSNSSKFKITFHLYQVDCDTPIGIYSNGDNLDITVDEDSGLIILNFSDNLSIIEPDTKYMFIMDVDYYGERITHLISTQVEFYTKMGIRSAIKIKEAHKTYETSLLLDNAPTYTAGGTTNLTPYLLYSKAKLTFYSDKIQIHVYKTSQNQADFSFANINKVIFNIDGMTINVAPDVVTSDSLDFTIAYPIDLDSGEYEINFTLTNNSTYIHYDFHKVDLSVVDLALNYDIYHVPIIRYDDYANIIEPSVPNSPYLRLQSVYDTLAEYVILGCKHNIKFIKTFGRLINIKYNATFKYSSDYIDVVKIPLDLKIDVVVSKAFNPNTDAAKIKNIILEYQNSQTSIESNVKNSLIESKVISEVDTIYSIDIKSPSFDIIYDISDVAITHNYNEYTPELIRIQSITLNYIKNYDNT